MLTLIAALCLAQPVILDSPLTYPQGLAQAKATGKPMVVFVGVPGRTVKDCLTVAAPDPWGRAGKRIIVTWPGGEHWRADLPANANEDEIRRAVAPRMESGAGQGGSSARFTAVPSRSNC
jgi:hypothetical protein